MKRNLHPEAQAETPREPDNTEFGTNPTRQKRGRKSNLLEQSTIFLSILVQMHFQEFKKVLSSRTASAQEPGVFRLTKSRGSSEYSNKHHITSIRANRKTRGGLPEPGKRLATYRKFSRIQNTSIQEFKTHLSRIGVF